MKKKIWIPLVIFFSVMAIATVVAENLYYGSLPIVTVGTPTQGTLSISYRSQGNVRYGKQPVSLCAGFDFQDVTLLAEDGGRVEKDDPVYCVPAEEVLLLQKLSEAAILDLEDQNKQISPDGSRSGLSERESLQYEINELRIADLERNAEELELLYENGGIVPAGAKGTVAYTARSGAPVQKGQSIALLTADTARRYVEWQMPAEQGRLFAIGDVVEVILQIITIEPNGEVVTASRDYELPIEELTYAEQTQTYSFHAGIPEKTNLSMADGTGVTVICRFESEEQYSYIVPESAVTFERDSSGDTGRGYIYAVQSRQKAYGEEYYVIPFYIEVSRRLGNYVALDSVPNGYTLVMTSTEPLANEMAVKLK